MVQILINFRKYIEKAMQLHQIHYACHGGLATKKIIEVVLTMEPVVGLAVLVEADATRQFLRTEPLQHCICARWFTCCNTSHHYIYIGMERDCMNWKGT